MRRSLLWLAAMAALTFANVAAAQNAAGDWIGALTTPRGTLHIAVHLKRAADGSWTGTLDSPDQGGYGAPIDNVNNDGGALTFAFPAAAGRYTGKWDAAVGGFVGTWSQGLSSQPLTFKPGRIAMKACGPSVPLPTPELPPASGFLFWTPAQQLAGYRNIERVYPTHLVRRGAHVAPLPGADPPLDFRFDCDGAQLSLADFVGRDHIAGVLVIQDGKILAEQYGLGQTPTDRWTNFSVGKSITSTLVGAAINDGAIKSLDDPVAAYLPELKGSAYDGVTVRQLITMTSGVRWNEDYGDPKSDVNALDGLPVGPNGENPILAYMAKLPRAAPAGAVFHYSTGEANLIGLLVARAVKAPLADYLSKTIWAPYGMEKDAVWLVQRGSDFEVGGCCVSMTLRDAGRFGEFMLGGGVAAGRNVLPKGWIAEATSNHAPGAPSGRGYGYQWWVEGGGAYAAVGIFGQLIYIDPPRRLVIVVQSAWPKAEDPDSAGGQGLMLRALLKAVDARAAKVSP